MSNLDPNNPDNDLNIARENIWSLATRKQITSQHARALRDAARDRVVLAMSLRKQSTTVIAKALGVSRSMAWRLRGRVVSKGMATAEQVKALAGRPMHEDTRTLRYIQDVVDHPEKYAEKFAKWKEAEQPTPKSPEISKAIAMLAEWDEEDLAGDEGDQDPRISS